MNSNVVSLAERITQPGLGPSPARCTACGHTWEATAALGETWLTCPACESQRGLFRYPSLIEDCTHIFSCPCGCDAFAITIRGNDEPRVTCVACGTDCDPWRSIDE